MNIPLFDLQRHSQFLKDEVLSSWESLIDRTAFTSGEETEHFEELFRKLCNSSYGVGVRSGTSSLFLTLQALGIGLGDEVITTPVTFSATSDAIIISGARPIFVDVDPLTGNINPDLIEEKISSKTKAILVVHLYGVPCEMDKLKKIAQKYKIFLVEDGSHAHGSLYKKKPVGSFGIAGCFSLYPSKTLGCFGNAGIVVTSQKNVADKVRRFAHHGMSKRKYYHLTIGYNELIDNVQSAVLGIEMKYLAGWIKRRMEIAQYYNTFLKSRGVRGMFWSNDTSPSLYVYTFKFRRRKELSHFLQKKGIGTGIYYPLPLHLQISYKKMGYKNLFLPDSEAFCREIISLPLFPELSDAEVEYVTNSLKEFL